MAASPPRSASPTPPSSSQGTPQPYVAVPSSPAAPAAAAASAAASSILHSTTSAASPAPAILAGSQSSTREYTPGMYCTSASSNARESLIESDIEQTYNLIRADSDTANQQFRNIKSILILHNIEDMIFYSRCELGLACTYNLQTQLQKSFANKAFVALNGSINQIKGKVEKSHAALFDKLQKAYSDIASFVKNKWGVNDDLYKKIQQELDRIQEEIGHLEKQPTSASSPAASAPSSSASSTTSSSAALASTSSAPTFMSDAEVERELEAAFGLLQSKEANKFSEARGKFEYISGRINKEMPIGLIHVALCKLGEAQTFPLDISNARHFLNRAFKFLNNAESQILRMTNASLQTPLYVKMQEAYSRIADSAQAILGADSSYYNEAKAKLKELGNLITTFTPAPTSTASPAIFSPTPAAAPANTPLPPGTVAIKADPSKFFTLKDDWSLQSNAVEREISAAFQYLENGKVDEARRRFNLTSTNMDIKEPQDKINYALCIFGKLFCTPSLEQLDLQRDVSYAFEQLERAESSLPKIATDLQILLYQRMELLYKKIGPFLIENGLPGADVAAQKAQLCLEKFTELSTSSAPQPRSSPAPAAASADDSLFGDLFDEHKSTPTNRSASPPAPGSASPAGAASGAASAGASASDASKQPPAPPGPARNSGPKPPRKASTSYFTPRSLAIASVVALALGTVGFYYAQPSLFASLRTRAVSWLREQLKRFGI